MGITVHFEGQLRNEAAYCALVEATELFASARRWKTQKFSVEHAKLSRVRNEEDWNYEGPTKGIEVLPHPSSEPVRLEFDEQLFIQEYTKTQFAPPDVHIELVHLLDAISTHFTSFQIVDEAEYYETRDKDLLLKHRDRCFELMDEHLANDNKLRGPVRLSSGRIADLISGASQETSSM